LNMDLYKDLREGVVPERKHQATAVLVEAVAREQ